MDPLFLAFQQAVAGRYSLDREIGRGGMGVVYLAREVHLDRPVAIKLLPPERASQRTLRDRFLREARLAAKLSHPNIIPIHSVEETNGHVYYVMAFVDGETLTSRVRTRGPLPATEGARVLREVAWALAYAHEQGLVHRDIKPDNILLEGATSRVLVADFGIAAALSDVMDGISGTPEFMSPEQALGTQLDARSDIYSLGATAYYAFSGKFPFEGKTPTEVLAKQVTEPAPPLTSLGLSVPRKLASLIDRCLAKAADDRPASAKVIAEQLGTTLELRREMPVALRTFVRTTSRLNGPGTLLTVGLFSTALFISGAFAVNATARMGPLLAVAVVLAGAVAAPFIAMVDAAATVIKRGFTHRDVVPAYEEILTQAREEMAMVNQASYPAAKKILGGLSLGGLAIAVARAILLGSPAATKFLTEFFGWRNMLWFDGLSILGSTFFVLAGCGYLALHSRNTEPEGEFWAKTWKGRFGRWAFAAASKFAKPEHFSALTHRATELSLGMAAEQLYESLPKATRKQLADVPDTLKHLQTVAQELRRRHESLVDALAAAPDSAVAEYADVREMRDTLHAKLSDTVGALETIRLNLLRLHAGSLSVHSVTTHLGIAADVADEVDRLIAAQGEVESALKFPRTPATTPV
jgi:hypothetical protein